MTSIEDGLPIRLQHLRSLDLRPGDTLIVTAHSTSVPVMRELRDYIEAMQVVPDGVTLAVLPAGTEVGVLRPGGGNGSGRSETLDTRTASGTVAREAEVRRLTEELGVHSLVPPDPWGPATDSMSTNL